jgi:glucosamine--fructose-6-phosphate aminotransferase (isomerizing)
VVEAIEYGSRAWRPVRAAVADEIASLHAMVERVAGQLDVPIAVKRGQTIALAGIGASFAAIASPLLSFDDAGYAAVRISAADLAHRPSPPDRLTVAVSQSGRSSELIDAMRRHQGGATIALTNYTPSPLEHLADRTVNLGNVSDSSVATVTLTGSVLALTMLADRLAGTVETNGWHAIVHEAAQKVDAVRPTLTEVAGRLAACSCVDVVGPVPLASAVEGIGLMLREGPRRPSAAFETRQYLHGAMDSASAATGHLILGGAREAQLAQQLRERSDNVAFVDVRGAGPGADVGLGWALGPPQVAALPLLLLGQHFVMDVAAAIGVDMDEPAFRRIDTKTTSLETR